MYILVHSFLYRLNRVIVAKEILPSSNRVANDCSGTKSLLLSRYSPFKLSLHGYKFVLTMTGYFSKYVEAVPIVDKSAFQLHQPY